MIEYRFTAARGARLCGYLGKVTSPIAERRTAHARGFKRNAEKCSAVFSSGSHTAGTAFLLFRHRNILHSDLLARANKNVQLTEQNLPGVRDPLRLDPDRAPCAPSPDLPPIRPASGAGASRFVTHRHPERRRCRDPQAGAGELLRLRIRSASFRASAPEIFTRPVQGCAGLQGYFYLPYIKIMGLYIYI